MRIRWGLNRKPCIKYLLDTYCLRNVIFSNYFLPQLELRISSTYEEQDWHHKAVVTKVFTALKTTRGRGVQLAAEMRSWNESGILSGSSNKVISETWTLFAAGCCPCELAIVSFHGETEAIIQLRNNEKTEHADLRMVHRDLFLWRETRKWSKNWKKMPGFWEDGVFILLQRWTTNSPLCSSG